MVKMAVRGDQPAQLQVQIVKSAQYLFWVISGVDNNCFSSRSQNIAVGAEGSEYKTFDHASSCSS